MADSPPGWSPLLWPECSPPWSGSACPAELPHPPAGQLPPWPTCLPNQRQLLRLLQPQPSDPGLRQPLGELRSLTQRRNQSTVSPSPAGSVATRSGLPSSRCNQVASQASSGCRTDHGTTSCSSSWPKSGARMRRANTLCWEAGSSVSSSWRATIAPDARRWRRTCRPDQGRRGPHDRSSAVTPCRYRSGSHSTMSRSSSSICAWATKGSASADERTADAANDDARWRRNLAAWWRLRWWRCWHSWYGSAYLVAHRRRQSRELPTGRPRNHEARSQPKLRPARRRSPGRHRRVHLAARRAISERADRPIHPVARGCVRRGRHHRAAAVHGLAEGS